MSHGGNFDVQCGMQTAKSICTLCDMFWFVVGVDLAYAYSKKLKPFEAYLLLCINVPTYCCRYLGLHAAICNLHKL